MTPRRSRHTADEELQFADHFGKLMFSMPPIAGRMLGLLLITNEPYLSSRDLVERLGISPASV